MKNIEHKVGERFELDKLIYEVKENNSCVGCSFFIENENHCTDQNNRCGKCTYLYRQDNKNVIFVQIGEAED